MKKPTYIYEIGIPVSEYWVYSVKAKNKIEAYEKIKNCDDSAEQVYSLSAPLGRKRNKIFSRKLTKP